MRYFNFISSQHQEEIFHIPPGNFDKYTPKDLLQHALGALLYFPAIKPGIANFIQSNISITSIVFCLEDAIGDNQVAQAQKQLLAQLKELKILNLSGELPYLPLLFIRVRTPEHLKEIGIEYQEVLSMITGFVFPKFGIDTAESYFSQFNKIKKQVKSPLYALPTLEGLDVIEREKRVETLTFLKEVLDQNYDSVLNLRIGATDFLGLYRLRRNVNFTIYDISIIKDCIGDIVNFFSRLESPYVISGGVWEFFPDRETRERKSTKALLSHPAQSKLIEEVQLDLVNGLWGKTAIHPSQLFPIQSNYAIIYEDYLDAMDIIADQGSIHGASGSKLNNKMNEYKPHQHWANKILTRARIFGVLKKHKNYESLFV